MNRVSGKQENPAIVSKLSSFQWQRKKQMILTIFGIVTLRTGVRKLRKNLA